MSEDLWDIHDRIGSKPGWFYAACLDDYMAGWESPPPSTDDVAFDEIVAELVGTSPQGCQKESGGPCWQEQGGATEGARGRAEPLPRTPCTGTSRPDARMRPAFAP